MVGLEGAAIARTYRGLSPESLEIDLKAVIEGNTEKAEKIQDKIDPIADFHQQEVPFSHMIPILKVMMDEFELCSPTVLPPLTRLGAKEEEQIRKSMRELDFAGFEPWANDQ